MNNQSISLLSWFKHYYDVQVSRLCVERGKQEAKVVEECSSEGQVFSARGRGHHAEPHGSVQSGRAKEVGDRLLQLVGALLHQVHKSLSVAVGFFDHSTHAAHDAVQNGHVIKKEILLTSEIFEFVIKFIKITVDLKRKEWSKSYDFFYRYFLLTVLWRCR